MADIIIEILKGLDYGIDVTSKVKMLITKYTNLQDDHIALQQKHLILETKYRNQYEELQRLKEKK